MEMCFVTADLKLRTHLRSRWLPWFSLLSTKKEENQSSVIQVSLKTTQVKVFQSFKNPISISYSERLCCNRSPNFE